MIKTHVWPRSHTLTIKHTASFAFFAPADGLDTITFIIIITIYNFCFKCFEAITVKYVYITRQLKQDIGGWGGSSSKYPWEAWPVYGHTTMNAPNLVCLRS